VEAVIAPRFAARKAVPRRLCDTGGTVPSFLRAVVADYTSCALPPVRSMSGSPTPRDRSQTLSPTVSVPKRSATHYFKITANARLPAGLPALSIQYNGLSDGRLTAPEPGTIALLATALFGLVQRSVGGGAPQQGTARYCWSKQLCRAVKKTFEALTIALEPEAEGCKPVSAKSCSGPTR
jgi:hypothetical protein